MNKFMDSIKSRRSIYSIGKNIAVSDDEIIDMIKQALMHSPTPYNSQANRAVLLIGEDHDDLWDIVLESLKKVVSEKNFAKTQDKIQSFKNGYGTILFFEDEKVTKALMQKFPLYKDSFSVWAMQAAGMFQHIVWTALCDMGLGASLQHYNPLIDDAVKVRWNLPIEWKLLAQMPFGKILGVAGEKEFVPVEKTFRVFR
ncbi:MAG: nitroreductase family protein [Clostridiales bacterium]|nr:nitroreductase family protein [Clostridiales bacterium]